MKDFFLHVIRTRNLVFLTRPEPWPTEPTSRPFSESTDKKRLKDKAWEGKG